MTHAYATLEISQSAFDEIRAKLETAGYQHAFAKDGVIDMHGIAVQGDGTPNRAKVILRMVRNIVLMHFGTNQEVDRIGQEVEEARVSDVDAVRALVELHLKLARESRPSMFSCVMPDGAPLPGPVITIDAFAERLGIQCLNPPPGEGWVRKMLPGQRETIEEFVTDVQRRPWEKR